MIKIEGVKIPTTFREINLFEYSLLTDDIKKFLKHRKTPERVWMHAIPLLAECFNYEGEIDPCDTITIRYKGLRKKISMPEIGTETWGQYCHFTDNIIQGISVFVEPHLTFRKKKRESFDYYDALRAQSIERYVARVNAYDGIAFYLHLKSRVENVKNYFDSNRLQINTKAKGTEGIKKYGQFIGIDEIVRQYPLSGSIEEMHEKVYLTSINFMITKMLADNAVEYSRWKTAQG